MAFTELTQAEIQIYYSHYFPNLERHRVRDHWCVPCLLHNGKDNNLKIQIATGLFYCFSLCGLGGNTFTFEKRLHDIDKETARANVFRIIGRVENNDLRRRAPVAYYDYTDESGRLLCQKIRYEPKGFSLRRPNPDRANPHRPPDPKKKLDWINKLGNTRQVLYRLPKVLAASIVFVVEGEKDVETIEKLGLVGTCNPLGAGKWRTKEEQAGGRISQFTERLRGKEYVYVIRDNDAEGLDHAHDVAGDIKRAGIPVKLLTLTMGKDVSDWVAAGYTEEDLVRIAEESPDYEPPQPSPEGCGAKADGEEMRDDEHQNENTNETERDDEHQDKTSRGRKGLPQIIVPNRPLASVSGEAQSALRRHNHPVPHLFLRGARIVEVIADELGRYFLRGVDESAMRGYLTRAASFLRPTASRTAPSAPNLTEKNPADGKPETTAQVGEKGNEHE